MNITQSSLGVFRTWSDAWDETFAKTDFAKAVYSLFCSDS